MQTIYFYVPGLGGEPVLSRQRTAVKKWRTENRDTQFLDPQWTDPTETYHDKFNRLINDIERNMNDEYDRICIVGISAGGSLALNLFNHFKPDKRMRYVSIGGKVVGAEAIGSDYSKPHPALVPSVERSDVIALELKADTKKRMYTIGPLFDEVVFTRYMKVPGVRHKTIPLVEHVLSIYVVIRFLPGMIFRFAESDS